MKDEPEVKGRRPGTSDGADAPNDQPRLEVSGQAALDAAEQLAREACHEHSLRSRRQGEPPTTVGRYRILRELGRGGQATVYLARDERLGREVALKLLPWNTGPGEQQRLEREAEITAGLDLPQVCKVFEVGRAEGTTFVAMQYVSGSPLSLRIRAADGVGPVDLRARIDRDPRALAPRIDDILAFVSKVARAVHRVHLEGVVHRDLKPANIVLTNDGDPVVLDFGLARSDDQGLESLTATGDVFGTPAYMAPELLGDEPRPADRSSDVWALGCILWELLFARRPFDAPTRSALLEAIRSQPLPAGRRLLPGLSPELEAVLQVALERDLSRRYRTANALAEDLERVRQRLPVAARTAPWTLRARRAIQRHPLRFAVGTLGFLLLTVTPTAIAVQAKLAEAEIREQQKRAEELAMLALDAISDTLVELGQSVLANLPGELERRRTLLARAEELLRPIEADPALRTRVAAQILNIHFQMGQLADGTQRNAGATRHMRRVLDLIEQHPDIALGASSLRIAELTARTAIATGLRRDGDLDQARKELEAARRSPRLRDDPRCRVGLELLFADFAQIERDWPSCLRHAEAGLAELARIDPDSPSLLTTDSLPVLTSDLYAVHGVALRHLDRLGEAIASFDQAIAVYESAAIDRFDFTRRMKLTNSLEARSFSLRDSNRQTEALADLDRAIAILQDLRELAQDPTETRFLVGQAHVHRIRLLKEMGAVDDAIAELEPTFEILATGADELSDSSYLSLATSTVLHRLAILARDMARDRQSLRAAMYAAAARIAYAGHERFPQHAALLRRLVSVARGDANLLVLEGDSEAAEAALLRLCQTLETTGANRPPADHYYAYRDLSKVQAELGKFALSHEAAGRAMDFARQSLARSDRPSSAPQFQFVALRARLTAAIELGLWDEINAACDNPMRFVSEFLANTATSRQASEFLTHPLYTASERYLDPRCEGPWFVRIRLAVAIGRLHAAIRGEQFSGRRWNRTRRRLVRRWTCLLLASIEGLVLPR